MPSSYAPARPRRAIAALAALTLVTTLAGPAAAAPGGQGKAGFKTSIGAMLTPLAAGASVEALITTGDTLGGGYRFEAIPDGIALQARGAGRVDLYVNHETSLVPFPYNPPFGGSPPTEANLNDFDNSQVSQLALNRNSAGILSGKYAIASEANYQRFCTNYVATDAEGFDRPILFANEEAQDWVFRTGEAWPGPDFIAPGTPGAEQAGVTAAYDVRTGQFRTIYGMGRLNHENTVAIPGYDDLVVLTTDDTFFTSQLAEPYKPAWSQLYTYIAPDTDALWNDEGELWAFVSDTAGYDDYFDFAPGDPTEIDGHFIQVPKDIAVGKDADGNEHLSGDFPGMLPPPAVVGAPPDGPQWVLDQWGNAENNNDEEDVFRFVRLEDIAYDKRPGMSNIIYIADTGRASRAPAADLRPQPGLSTNGRIWRIELDPENPTENVKLSILVEGDNNLVAADNRAGAFNEIHQPDNVETTANGSLLVQEDPSSANQYAFPREANETPARIWHIDLNAPDPDASKVTVAEVDQSLDEEPGYDVDGPQTSPPTIIRASMGVWESSGIVDASAVFGPGAFLVTIQAHSLWVEKADGPDDREPAGKDYTFKREGGQLVLLRIPGA